MKLLLDTHTLLWLMMDLGKIPPALLEVLANPMNRRYLSVVSVWEIIFKWQLGKLNLPKPPVEFVTEVREKGQILPLALEDAAVMQLGKLPKLHNDPFDRMLICQAIEHQMTFVTNDSDVTQYPLKTLWL